MKSLKIAIAALSTLIAVGAYAADTTSTPPAATHKTVKKAPHKQTTHKKSTAKKETAPAAAPAAN